MERCLQTPNSHQWFCKFLLTELIDGSGTCSYKKYPYNAPTYQPLGRWDGIFHYIPPSF
ncbi:hypothetical protein KP13_04177 [Klebsiella pneumoniae subsp. pneumoniae Kp13]|nr:hypothetical protein KP13_04177 [Klebsiella pneumoniae subsp. pneumoniae Kp13]